MISQLDFLKCYYRPAFFHIKIDLPVDLQNLSELTDATWSLYLHEYIHFIQDISTIYGLMNISTINYYIQDCAARISRQDTKAFSTPLTLRERDDYGFLNFELRPIYLGASINPKRKSVSFLSYRRRELESDFDSAKVEVVELTLKDEENGEDFLVQFGGNLITEGMAHLAERYVYAEILENQGVSLPVDEYPYCIVEKVAKEIYPALAEEDLLLIAVCDCCLMTYHPGLSFIRALEFLKKENFLENYKDDEALISILYKNLSALLKGNHYDFDTIIEDVRSSIKNYFKVENLKGNNKWIDVMFDRIKVFRNEIPDFIVDVLSLGDLMKNPMFLLFHQTLGSPLILNGGDLATITLPKDFVPTEFRPDLFWAINQMLRIFSNHKAIPCELKAYCINSKKLVDPELVIDHRCDIAPWERYNDEHLCPMGVMWKHWGLSGYYPESPNPNA